MASSASPSLLPGQSPPLAVITSTDRGGVIAIVTALGPAFALVSLLIRVYVRYQFSPNRFAWDDGFVVAAFAFSIFQNACVFLEVHEGLGKTIARIDPHNLIEIQKAAYADDILYIASVWLTKVSVALLFLRLSPKRGHRMASKWVTVITIVTGLVSVLIVALRCNLSRPWININSKNAQCAGLLARWEIVAAFDIAMEILLFAVSVYVLHALRIPFSKKAHIVVAFGLRLPLIVPIVLRLHYLSHALNSSNYTLTVTYAVICKQIEILYAIIGATIPCLRPFMTATVTHYGGAAEGPRSKTGSYGTPDRSTNSTNHSRQHPTGGLRLAKLASRLSPGLSNPSNASGSQSSRVHGMDHHGTHTTNVVAGKGIWTTDEQSVGSAESNQVLIRTEISHTVEHLSNERGEVVDMDVIGTAM